MPVCLRRDGSMMTAEASFAAGVGLQTNTKMHYLGDKSSVHPEQTVMGSVISILEQDFVLLGTRPGSDMSIAGQSCTVVQCSCCSHNELPLCGGLLRKHLFSMRSFTPQALFVWYWRQCLLLPPSTGKTSCLWQIICYGCLYQICLFQPLRLCC